MRLRVRSRRLRAELPRPPDRAGRDGRAGPACRAVSGAIQLRRRRSSQDWRRGSKTRRVPPVPRSRPLPGARPFPGARIPGTLLPALPGPSPVIVAPFRAPALLRRYRRRNPARVCTLLLRCRRTIFVRVRRNIKYFYIYYNGIASNERLNCKR